MTTALLRYHDRARPVPPGWRSIGPAPGHHGHHYEMLEQIMETSERGLDLIMRHEGLRLTAYQDSGGVWTIGYGHTENVCPGDKISEQRAEELLVEDVEWAEQAVDRLVDAPLTQVQFDALTSFVFNVGSDAFESSDLLEAVNRRDPTTVAMEFPRWRRSKGKKLLGLSRRRVDEAKLFLSEVDA